MRDFRPRICQRNNGVEGVDWDLQKLDRAENQDQEIASHDIADDWYLDFLIAQSYSS